MITVKQDGKIESITLEGVVNVGPIARYDGQWLAHHVGRSNDAVVMFIDEPETETGMEGWCWWADGNFGKANSLDDAKAAAERHLER